MKQLLVLSAALLFSLDTIAAPSQAVPVGHIEGIVLNVTDSRLALQVSYPGPDLSGVCRLDIWAKPESGQVEQSISRLAKMLRVRGTIPVTVTGINENVLTIDLKRAFGAYAVQATISTANGKSLREVIRAAFGYDRTVYVVPSICK